MQLAPDGHRAYLEAVEGAFGADVDYAQPVKFYGEPTGAKGHSRKYSPSQATGIRKRAVEGKPAMAAGVADTLWSVEDIAAIMDERAPKPGPRGPSRKRAAVAGDGGEKSN